MNEFYGYFDKEKHPFTFDTKEKGCWISTKSGPVPQPDGGTVNVDTTYCMKPIRLDVIKSNGRKMLFVVAGGNFLGEDGQPQGSDATPGLLGLIILTPNGANLGVVGTNDLYEGYEAYGGYPQRNTVTVHKLGPNGTYGWVAKLGYAHSGYEYEWVRVYGVIGHSVERLTTITTLFTSGEASGCGEEDQERCSTLSVQYLFDTRSSATLYYPIMLQASGNYHGRRFRGSYRLVFDKNSLTYLALNTMPDEIKPDPFITLPEPGTLSLACKGTGGFWVDQKGSMGIIINYTARSVQFGLFSPVKITGLDDARVAFGDSRISGTIDRMTGDAQVTVDGNTAYSLQCKPVSQTQR
jgi:hypothetical protein